MTPTETVMLVRLIRALCPQQRIDEYTPDAWHEVIGHLDFDAARNAVIAVKHSQPFVDPSDIIREAKRAKTRALADNPESHPSSRPYAQAVAESNMRELGAAPSVPPNEEYQAAVISLETKLKEKAERAMLVNRETERRADEWIKYALNGKLPREMPQGEPAAPRWQQLPGDPPELRSWLTRQTP